MTLALSLPLPLFLSYLLTYFYPCLSPALWLLDNIAQGQCLDKKALVFLPPVEASWLEVGQLAEGQRQPPVAMAFSPLGANLTLRGNT